MTPAAEALTRKLVAALDDEAALTEQHRDEVVVPFELSSARKRIRVLTADLTAALNEPLKIKPWTPWLIGGGK